MENEPIKELSVADLLPATRNRYEQLSIQFHSNFNEAPILFARAPGRVNLIGEHIDYCGYSVLPMAIEHDIVIALSLNDRHELVLTNCDSSFTEYRTPVDKVEISETKPQWHDYFLSGFKGVLDKCHVDKPQGMNVCLSGHVPKSAGLSSSSALVVCAALATLCANKLKLSKTELAETCAASERYVGTIGGGMDQAISCLAESGAAKLIDFNPLRVTKVSLPDGSQFVITNSCVEANKAATNQFNTRVVECRLAAQVLARASGLDWRTIRKPLDLQRALGCSLVDLIDLTRRHLHESTYAVDELCTLLEITRDELATHSLSQNTTNVAEFQLYRRALHVFSEAQRVHDFRAACALPPLKAFHRLGELMNDSHESCRDLYDCSCAELDKLTDICRQSGAYGSRLTGAGWGGCVVSLIPHDSLDEFLSNVRKLYYNQTPRLASLANAATFSTKPSDGIFIVRP